MIREGIILLRIQHFQQRAARITAVIVGKLINLIQHHNRIRNSASLDAFHDAARHRSNVCTAVSANFRFVARAAQTDADIFPVQRPGNALPDGSFAGTRRTYKQKNRAGLFLVQIHDRDLLQDTVFHFFQAIVIFIQNLCSFFQINRLHRLCLPGKASHEIKIIVQHPVLI